MTGFTDPFPLNTMKKYEWSIESSGHDGPVASGEAETLMAARLDGERWLNNFDNFGQGFTLRLVLKEVQKRTLAEFGISRKDVAFGRYGPPSLEAPIRDLAAIIREVDGDHTLGASALAEAIMLHPSISVRSLPWNGSPHWAEWWEKWGEPAFNAMYGPDASGSA